MSDSEEAKPGASSALSKIASAYSDSDSSQENSEDCSPQKSLGSLVENLRAEAKRFEGDLPKGCEAQTRTTPTPANISLDAEKNQSVTKIVRLDSGKVVKIRTSPGSKALEFRHEESHSRSGINVTDVGIDGNVRPAISPINTQNILSENFNVTIEEPLLSDSTQREVKTDFNNSSSNHLETGLVHDDNNRFGLNIGFNSATNTVNHPQVHSAESINSENSKTMGMRNTKEEVKPEGEIIIENNADDNFPQDKQAFAGNRQVEGLHNQNEQHSKTLVSGSSSIITKCDSDIEEITPVNTAQETIRALNITQNQEVPISEPKTESNILNAYLMSKQGLKTEDNSQNNAADTRNYEINRNREVMFRGSHFERGNLEKLAAAGSAACSNINARTEAERIVKTDENLGFNAEGLVSKLDMYEVKPRPELKPLPKLERLRVKSPVAGTENLLKKTDEELQASSPALYKMLESCESAANPEMKKGPSPAPIKLKRNFSCLSSASNVQPEKKFIPEPSEAARITPSDSEVSSDVPGAPPVPAITIHPVESRPQQEETMKSPPRIKIPSPNRSPLSPTFQQVSPQSYQPSFTNMINTSPNQAASFQPLKKSPQPVSQQQRITRRDEQKRTLPLILRKADISSVKSRESQRVDDSGAKTPCKRDDVNASSKVISEGEISIETISSESQEQSASVPFSNSSSNQENSNFATSVNFENVIGTRAAAKEPEAPLSEDGGSDNARPPPTPTKDEQDEKQPISFLSQTVEPVEMPTIIIPKKRGRPRKFPLPEPSTLVGTWPTPDKSGKSKSGKRKKSSKKVKAEPDGTDDDDTSKKRYVPRYKKKIKSTGEEQEVTRTFNKKGRMEVMTEGCKPVTVNQITEYFWPPISTLPPGEKPEGLMIQEQISEYLGVKSFKRKYPSIKRRPVDMEERNYLQENGYVSENMCDLGLTAVFSADIMEIMYNDFPNKFEEYRRYTREKKMKEQKALREKQAAENMDPRKEALESIVSWNTEFNSTRKMDKPKKSYNFQVLLGEWYERKVDQEFQIAMYLKKKERGQLLLSKMRKLFSNLLRDVQLSLPTIGLAYGGLVQLVAPDVPGYAPSDMRGSNKGLVLAVTLEADDVDQKQDFDENMLIIGSPVLGPCARNSFYIDPEDKRKEGQPLCFGDVFSLRCGAPTQFPFYISVPVLSPFGVVGKSGYPVPRLSMHRSFDSRFRVFHLDERMRNETLGVSVSPFEKILLVHAPVNVPLCVESSYWGNSLFSAECEVSIHSTLNLQKEYQEANKWIFVVGTSKK